MTERVKPYGIWSDTRFAFRNAVFAVVRIAELSLVVAAVGYVAEKTDSRAVDFGFLVIWWCAGVASYLLIYDIMDRQIYDYGNKITKNTFVSFLVTLMIVFGVALFYSTVIPRTVDALVASQGTNCPPAKLPQTAGVVSSALGLR